MSDLKNKLEALLQKQGVMRGSQWAEKAEEEIRQKREGAFEIDKVVPGEIVGDATDGFYLVRKEYPLLFPMGTVTLGEALQARPEHIAYSACDDGLCEFDAADALFIDTETIGLAGGTGTVAFLVGVGYFDGDTFRLDQCFMRDYEDELPMLEYLDGLFRRGVALVSYNGKSFDWPLLRNRFIQNRMPFMLEAISHLDLVHSARRMWKRRVRDCSLTNIEREVLGIHRQGDVPSWMIPQMWFDYLRSRDARPLQAVFYHHEMDILSLVAVTAALSRHVSTAQQDGLSDGDDQISLVRLSLRQRRYEEVIAYGRRLLDGDALPELRYECQLLMMQALKRAQRWLALKECIECLLGEFPQDLEARLELAKLHEHRTRDLAEAQRVCEETIRLLEVRAQLRHRNPERDEHVAMFRSRLERIQRKMARGRRWSDGEGEPEE